MGENLATEASIACECHALKDAGMERVVAEANATNVGSLRVIEKLGMRLVGNINAGVPREPYYAVYLAEFRADMGRSKRWK
jgi:RimJ/RimL family protein N-acetyltransferase